MRATPTLRPELASVFRFVAPKHTGRLVRPLPPRGVLADLAGVRGVL